MQEEVPINIVYKTFKCLSFVLHRTSITSMMHWNIQEESITTLLCFNTEQIQNQELQKLLFS